MKSILQKACSCKWLQLPNLHYIETISERKTFFEINEINKWGTVGFFSVIIIFMGQFSKRELVPRVNICQLVISSTDVAADSWWVCYDGNFWLTCRKQRERSAEEGLQWLACRAWGSEGCKAWATVISEHADDKSINRHKQWKDLKGYIRQCVRWVDEWMAVEIWHSNEFFRMSFDVITNVLWFGLGD